MDPKPEPTQPVEPTRSPLKQIRTFQGDVANTIGTQKESLVSIQRAESARREAAPPALEPSSGKSALKVILLMLGSLIFLAGGVVGGWYAYTEYVKKTATPVISTPDNRLISVVRTVEVDAGSLSRSGIAEVVARESSVNLLGGEVVHINLPATTPEFLRALDARAPGNLVRAFEPIFMLGTLGVEVRQTPTVVATSTSSTNSTTTASTTEEVVLPHMREGSSVFLLIRLASFENAFAGMLAWETEMAEDIAQLFSTRLIARNLPQGAEFQDVTVRNKDSRALKHPLTGETVLIYSFFDTNTLIITDSEESLVSLLGKLTTELLSR